MQEIIKLKFKYPITDLKKKKYCPKRPLWPGWLFTWFYDFREKKKENWIRKFLYSVPDADGRSKVVGTVKQKKNMSTADWWAWKSPLLVKFVDESPITCPTWPSTYVAVAHFLFYYFVRPPKRSTDILGIQGLCLFFLFFFLLYFRRFFYGADFAKFRRVLWTFYWTILV